MRRVLERVEADAADEPREMDALQVHPQQSLTQCGHSTLGRTLVKHLRAMIAHDNGRTKLTMTGFAQVLACNTERYRAAAPSPTTTKGGSVSEISPPEHLPGGRLRAC